MRWTTSAIFIVLKTAIISSLMDLRNGQRPYLRFWNCVQGIVSIPRWACDFGIVSMDWRPRYFSSCAKSIQRWAYAFGVASMEQRLLFFLVRDGHMPMGLCLRNRVHGIASIIFRRARRPYGEPCFWNRVHGIAFIIFRRARRPYGDGLMFMELRPWNSAYYWQTGL